MQAWLVALALLACACPSKQANGPGSNGPPVPPAPPSTPNATTCDDVRPRVEQMYRAEAQVREPKRVDEAVADNTAMAMNDCAKDPARAVPCLARVTSVAELEKQCLIPLDEEGTDGEALAR